MKGDVTFLAVVKAKKWSDVEQKKDQTVQILELFLVQYLLCPIARGLHGHRKDKLRIINVPCISWYT